ncbi:hypothetical protein HMPREF7545_1312 [Selenomonas noxia ATCC 43541]|jgi:hypothetical protein|nr:hypothetical protein HMPREF7545_1312 [Selenomonas noxia ATCC 43541]
MKFSKNFCVLYGFQMSLKNIGKDTDNRSGEAAPALLFPMKNRIMTDKSYQGECREDRVFGGMLGLFGDEEEYSCVIT